MKCAEPSVTVQGSDVVVRVHEADVCVHFAWGDDDGGGEDLVPGEPGTTEWTEGDLIPVDTSNPGIQFLTLLLTKRGMQATTVSAAFDVEQLRPPRLARDGGRIEILLQPMQNPLSPLDPSWLGDGFGDYSDEDAEYGDGGGAGGGGGGGGAADGGGFNFDFDGASLWSAASDVESFAGFGQSDIGDYGYSSDGGESYAGFETAGSGDGLGNGGSGRLPATFPVVVAPFSVATEFGKIDTNHPDVSELPGTLAELAHANRYRNILPNKHSAVLLDPVDGEPFSSYINANCVRGYNAIPATYVATQGPLPTTIVDFWRMVWTKQSDVIVMVTGLIENGRTKCGRYWPADLVPPDAAHLDAHAGAGIMQEGRFRVAAISASRIGSYMKTSLRVSLLDDAGETIETRPCTHFWYDTWPDHGVPSNTTGVTEMLAAVRLHSAGGPDAPWIVHCSAGIGRTGTFIGIDMGMQQLQEGGAADVAVLIQQMRSDRGGMVQSAAQAAFIHTALEKFATAFNETKTAAAATATSDGYQSNDELDFDFGASSITLDDFAEVVVKRNVNAAVEKIMNIHLGIFNEDDDDDAVEYRRYARIGSKEASVMTVEYTWTTPPSASSFADGGHDGGGKDGSIPSCFWEPAVAPGSLADVDGGGAALTITQKAPWIPMYCKTPGYKTLEVTMRKVGHAPVMLRQAFNVLPAATPVLVRDGEEIKITLAAGVELQYSWVQPLLPPETGYVAGMPRLPLPDGVEKIAASLAPESVARIALDCSVASTKTLHVLAVRPGFASTPMTTSYEIVNASEPTFTRNCENIYPTMTGENPCNPRLFTTFGSPVGMAKLATEWLGNGPISLEDAVQMYLARGTADAKGTRLYWLATEVGKAPTRGSTAYTLIRAELPAVHRKADKFGPGATIVAAALDPSKCAAMYMSWGSRAPLPSADFAWPGESVPVSVPLDCSTPGEKVLNILGTHKDLLPASKTVVSTVDQLEAPRVTFAVMQDNPSARSTSDAAAPSELLFQTKLLPPPGSVYIASDITYSKLEPTAAATGDKGTDTPPTEGGAAPSPPPVPPKATAGSTYKTPFTVSAKSSILVQASRVGYASSPPCNCSPPSTGRVDPPSLSLVDGPEGVAVHVCSSTPRAQILVAKSWTTNSSGGGGGGGGGSGRSNVIKGSNANANRSRPQWLPLSGREGPDGFVVPVDCSAPGPHTVSAFGRKVGLGDSDPVSSITVQIERALAPLLELHDNGFSCTAPADAVVRYCYGVSSSEGAAVEIAALKLPTDPYRWTTVQMRDAAGAPAGSLPGGGACATQDFKFGEQMDPLRELERRGDTLHAWAVAFLPGKAPSLPVAWHKQLRHTPKMRFHSGGAAVLQGVKKVNNFAATKADDSIPAFLR